MGFKTKVDRATTGHTRVTHKENEMRYKIVAVTDHAPDKPITYTGEFTPVDGIQPIITAIVTEFGDPGKSTNESLIEWTGGESLYWDYIDKNDTEFIFYNDDTTYYVFIDS